ncbi:MAG: hypothetical protein ABSB19_12265 [Methylomonas sp.]|jgi:hypothetical protein
MKIPQLLYRGDADPLRERKLKEVRPGKLQGGLLTNLSNGGSGLEIFSYPLPESVERHVAIGWEKTHFLSFSKSRDKALAFAANPSKRTLQEVKSSDNWDTALITIETSRFIRSQEIVPGIFKCQYRGLTPVGVDPNISQNERIARLAAYGRMPEKLVDVLLIDVVSALCSRKNTNSAQTLANAKRDEEWLVLPLELPQNIRGELSSFLDDGCISKFECFKYKS